MSNLHKEINWLTELSDQQQEVLAGGKLGTSFQLKIPSGLSHIGVKPLVIGDLWNPDSKNDDGGCQKTETKDGHTETVKVVCEKTERYP